MFGISFEHILIVGVILIIVGPRRLPELGNTMGKAIKNFKDSFSGIEEASFKRLNPEPAANPAAANPNVAPVATAQPASASTTASTTAANTATAVPGEPSVNS